MGQRIGPTIAIDGFAQYKSQMKQIISQGKELASEMELTASSWDKDTSAKEKNRAKSENLQKQIENQEKLVAQLTKVVDEASKSENVNADQLSKWKTELNNAKGDLNGMKSQLGEMSDGVDDVGESEEDATKKTSTFADVLKANLLSEAITKGIEKIAGAIKGIAEGMVDFIGDAISAYSDYEQIAGGVETLFGEASATVMQKASEAYKTAGLSANEYMEQVTGFSASLIQSLGGDTEEAARIADIAIIAMSDNVNKMGTDMGSVQNAFQGFAKGNYTMLDNLKLGYGGTKEEMLRLVNDAGIAEKKFKSLDDVSFDQIIYAIQATQERLGIANATAEEAATTMEGSTNAMRASWQNLVAGLGNSNADISNLVKQAIDSALTWFHNIAPIIQQILPTIASALQQALPIVLSLIVSLMNSMLPSLINAGISLIEGIAKSLIDNIGLILTAVGTAIKKLVPKIVQYLPIILQGMVDLIMQIASEICNEENIGFFIQAIIGIVNAICEALPTVIETIITILPDLISGIINGIIENFPALLECAAKAVIAIAGAIVKLAPQLLGVIVNVVKQVGKKIVDFDWNGEMSKCWERIKEGLNVAIQGIKDFFASEWWTSAWSAIQSLWGKLKDAGKQIVGKIKDGLTGALSAIANIGKSIVEGIWNGISNSFTWIKDKIKGWVNNFLDYMKNLLGIHSPSRVMADLIGRNMALGIGEGFDNTMVGVTRDMATSVDASVVAGGATGGTALGGVTIYTQELTESQLDYIINRCNSAMGVMV